MVNCVENRYATKRPQFVSAAPVYDTGEEDTSNNKSVTLNLTQSAIININSEDDKRVPAHVHDHDYSKNGKVISSTEIPEFPEFANIGGSSNSSPSPSPSPSGVMSDHLSSPTSPSSGIQSPASPPEKNCEYRF